MLITAKQTKAFAVALLFGALISCTLGQSSNSSSSCTAKKTCGECIRTPDCVWCSQEKYERSERSPYPRCNTATKHMNLPPNTRCREEFIVNPTQEYKAIEDRSITKGNATFAAIQIRPQRIHLKLRVGQSYDLQLQYSQAKDYPVDLYYLMDLSKSMEDDKDELSLLGNLLAETMQNVTSNFRLGFGSFVDKVVMPFVSTVEKKKSEPCDKCVPAYGYQNHLDLTMDTSQFSGQVKNARVSGNLDAPEGGFDAIMQAIVCENDIGWREQARRIIVFSTDASFHYAGDGKLGGIVKPNDGQCHMANREYTMSTLQDYPSVAQINSKVKEKSINMIFAVTAEQIKIYERLSHQIQGSSCGVLDSKNVVQLVKQQYEKITSFIELRDNANTSFFKISYFSNCSSKDPNQWIETKKCGGLKVGTIVHYKIKIEVVQCPGPNELHKKTQTFTISPVGLNESLTVTVEMHCDCDCEIPGSQGYQPNSPACGNTGLYSCGICTCKPGRYGRFCQCDGTGNQSFIDDLACRADNTTDVICSGRGSCICGQCECLVRENSDEKIYGPHCQCTNFGCPQDNGKLCGGNGICDCGVCKCQGPFSGEACQCSTDTDLCYEPGKDKNDICNGHGKCECGKCVCETSSVARYYGRYCEKCPTCPGRCEELRACVQCRVHHTGEFEEEERCRSNCTALNQPEPELVDVASSDDEYEEKFCAFTDSSDGCRFYFVYGYNENRKLYIKAQRTKDCPPEPPLFWIVSGVVGAIVLVGLLFILLWKLLTHIHDRAEYARFEKERMSAKWDAGENPIYRQATSTFKNPMYNGR